MSVLGGCIDVSGVLTRVAASTVTHTFSLVREDGTVAYQQPRIWSS